MNLRCDIKQVAKKNKETYLQAMEEYKRTKEEEAMSQKKEEEELLKLHKQEALQLLKKKEKTDNLIKVIHSLILFLVSPKWIYNSETNGIKIMYIAEGERDQEEEERKRWPKQTQEACFVIHPIQVPT